MESLTPRLVRKPDPGDPNYYVEEPEDCPEVQRYFDGPDICRVNGKVCLLEAGLKCPTYQEYLDEEEG